MPELNIEVEAAWLRPTPWRFVGEDKDPNSPPPNGLDWGSVASGSKEDPRYVHVLQCVVHSEVTATDDASFRAGAARFGDELSDWWGLVCDWLDVLTVQDFAGLGRTQRSLLDDSVQLWSGDSNGLRRAGVNYQVMTGGMRWVEVLDRQQLQAAMDLAASGSSPHTEWLFIRDARSLLNAGEYRRAVIDACTAAELSVTALIDRKFDLAGTSEEDREEQFADHHGLARLIELHNRFRTGKLPKRLYQEVGDPRNKAAHTGAMPNEAEARAAIVKAAEVLALAFPLDSIAPGLASDQLRSSPHLGVLPRESPIVLTTGNALALNFEARRRERPQRRQPPRLTGAKTTRHRWWQLWRH
jgi:hypothetical protein